jgi:uncharacterized membrane protein
MFSINFPVPPSSKRPSAVAAIPTFLALVVLVAVVATVSVVLTIAGYLTAAMRPESRREKTSPDCRPEIANQQIITLGFFTSAA